MSEIDELKEKLEEANETIQELEQEVSGLTDEISDLTDTINNSFSEDDFNEQKESVSEKGFNAGYKACEDGRTKLKSWLEYRIEARL